MSDYLLDTHALLWAINEPDRLGPGAAQALRLLENHLLVSAASAWELSTKFRIGKLPGAGPWLEALDGHMSRLGAEVLPISWKHARLSGQLEWTHRDPFDRMLAAQAISESLVLVTVDPAFAGLPGLKTLW
ncbi:MULTISPECIES: type II toxin-antitoxin system VapC family toxin [unclassified Actinomyces]|uniref:type II toxin-antitoxin system VapC family toxin n=1 Tax=unclassified Actinomyces TaxID=2609248 RepID=UPI000D58CF6E|nr:MULTISPECIES: type II toxin-antitoxin system VapC family toxin [unclassified Actinomyces]RAX19006.1 type II toxin-antitoxin system VapC family toxin [Actinomyces sp. Z5]RAX20307.1 type II toxin-antitoxin system VapC family toxin [Actinomyces sp. Z3]